MPGRLVALLIGIDAYPAPLPPLEGCVNDVTAFADLLRGRAPAGSLALRVLTDAEATRDATIAAIRDHLGGAAADDVALLYFSGHGSQGDAPPELWPLEPDRRVETLVLADSRQPHSWDLADKELALLLGDVGAAGRTSSPSSTAATPAAAPAPTARGACAWPRLTPGRGR